ncbi:MAG: hypothetical protein KJO11_01985 [Gemmatimonadetes bacterium]|nr:hypothetical protein [Gemmatimonadota bacterium]
MGMRAVVGAGTVLMVGTVLLAESLLRPFVAVFTGGLHRVNRRCHRRLMMDLTVAREPGHRLQRGGGERRQQGESHQGTEVHQHPVRMDVTEVPSSRSHPAAAGP